MISRCPSCGSQVKDEELKCSSCDWDFIARRRVPKSEAAAPSAVQTPAPSRPPESDLFSIALDPLKIPLPDAPAPAPVAAAAQASPEPATETPPPASPPMQEPPAPLPAPVPQAAPSLAAEPAPPSPEPVPAAIFSRQNAPAASKKWIVAVTSAALVLAGIVAVRLNLKPSGVPHSKPKAASTPSAPPAAPSVAAVAPPTPAPAAKPAAAPAPKAPERVPASVSTPPLEPQASAPSLKPAQDPDRPTAIFAQTPRLVIQEDDSLPPALPVVAEASTPTPSAQEAPAAPPPPKPPDAPWRFEGTVFDLLTTKGVYAAKLSFFDAKGQPAGETETGPEGRFKISLPAGAKDGYTMKIAHGDYNGRYIDDADVRALREATPDERKLMMFAASRGKPWLGSSAKSVHRDLILVPAPREGQ